MKADQMYLYVSYKNDIAAMSLASQPLKILRPIFNPVNIDYNMTPGLLLLEKKSSRQKYS